MEITKIEALCQYILEWNGRDRAIVLAIEKSVFEEITSEIQENKGGIINSLQKEFEPCNKREHGLEEFVISENKIGFHGVLGKKEEDDFVKLSFRLPRNDKITKHNLFEAFSATMTVLTLYLERYTETWQMKKFLTFSTDTRKSGIYGGIINGWISPNMKEWLTSIGDVDLTEIVRAMLNASEIIRHGKWILMDGKWRQSTWTDFGVTAEKIIPDDGNVSSRAQNGKFYAFFFGGSINPGDSYQLEDEEEGYKLSCHNLDNAWQQLHLLIALAFLCNMYRDFLRKTIF